MKFPFYIAKRYLFAKSTSNAVNVISGVSVLGVSIGAFALILVLSVFSGLEQTTIALLNTFDPELKVTPAQGKRFEIDSTQLSAIRNLDGIKKLSVGLEEKVFLSYKDREYIAWLKGVDTNYLAVNHMDSTVYVGRWMGMREQSTVVLGHGVANKLGIRVDDPYTQLKIYAPKKGKVSSSRPDQAFTTSYASPVGIFAFDQEQDGKYIIGSLQLAQNVLGHHTSGSFMEISLEPGTDVNAVKNSLMTLLGNHFEVKTRREQHELVYKMMNTENVVTYLVFTLILIIALFNVTGSIVMLILDKKEHIKTLWALGTSESDIRKIFILEGLLISCVGGLIGLALGIALIFVQQEFGLIRVGSGYGVAYPVVLSIENILVVASTIFGLGYLAALLSVSRLSKKVILD